MCSHFQSIRDTHAIRDLFDFDILPDGGKFEMWPGHLGPFVRRRQPSEDGGDLGSMNEALLGSFGLIPHWARDTKIARQTYNARSETVAAKPSYREAWKRAHHCIIPAQAIFEPDWRSGKAVPTRISRVDDAPMGIAGLWAWWKSPQGDILHSFTMLTINADEHPLMRQFHRPTDEKRMVVILPEDRFDEWLAASAEHSPDFLRMFPADELKAELPASAGAGGLFDA